MKKIFLSSLSLFLFTGIIAQSEKYSKAMQSAIGSVDTLRSADGWTENANTFQRIADAEKNQWLPYYYAALGHVMIGYSQTRDVMAGTPDKVDPEADKAEELINKAEALSKDNSEIYVVKKMIATLRLMGDPMNRWQTYGPLAAEALQKAKSLNPDNPRVYLLEGQDKFFTPEQFGGSKTEAKALFEESMKKYESFKPETSLHPQWGLPMVKYFYGQIK
jgi:hypothetical protein